jgi:4-amino-4-deoxy-L-arabinose transferase-like glycosyltransferase
MTNLMAWIMNFFRKNKNLLLLLLLIFLTLSLRLVKLDSSPVRLTQDEMSIGYNAYSILKTGKDEWGKNFPLVFKAFGDYKLPLYIYSTVPFVAALGLNHISIKLVSVIAGSLLVLLIYKLMMQITKDKKIAYLSALMMAINPAPVHLSRQALESNLALLFFGLGIFYLIKTYQGSKKINPILSGIAFALTFYSYISYRLIVGFLALITFFIFIKSKKFKQLKYLVISFLLLLLPMMPNLVNISGTARFSHVSMFSDIGVDAEVNENRAFCFLQNPNYLPFVCKFLYNKPQVYTYRFVTNYFQVLSPQYLFLVGDEKEYLSNPDFGEFLLFLLPFYLAGLFYWFRKKGFEASIIKIGFLLSPIASALVGQAQIVRASPVVLFTAIFVATGISQIYSFFSKKSHKLYFSLGLTLLTIFSLAVYTVDYWFIYPAKFDNVAYQLNPNIATEIYQNEAKYDKIIINDKFNDPYIFFAFYNKIDPTYLQNNITRSAPDKFNFEHPISLGKIERGNIDIQDELCRGTTRLAYLTERPDELPSQAVYKNYAGVHIQAVLYDVDELRQYLIDKKTLEKICTTN